MPRLAPTKDTIRLLFALSGNQCAFPDCTQLLINTKNQFIGQICHIEAALPGGERFNPNQTEEERRHYNNLVLLCYPHHVETNEVQDFSVQKLIDIKKIHEAKYRTSEYQINNDTLNSIASDMEEYWREIERLNTIEHSY
ncbi:MAG: hypothetical protein H8D23_31230, partial [Candidatus Brocadiales bacterium]|nr:hypothetical protein [Candidatus Brocadiales bacterium]